jgi:hypothetical protein
VREREREIERECLYVCKRERERHFDTYRFSIFHSLLTIRYPVGSFIALYTHGRVELGYHVDV